MGGLFVGRMHGLKGRPETGGLVGVDKFGCRVTAIGASAIRESAFQPSAAGSRFPRLMAEQPIPESPTSVAVTWNAYT